MGPLKKRTGAAAALGGLLVLALAAAAFSAVPGLEQVRVSDPDVPDSGNHKVAGAPCPDGKRVVGAAGSTGGSSTQRGLTGLVPDAAGRDLVQVNAVGEEDDDGDSASWQATAVAICAQPPAGLELFEEDGVANAENKSTVVSCPPGKQVVGTGGFVSRSGSGAPLGDLALDDLTPDDELTSVTVTGQEDEDGTDVVWDAKAYAICADPLPGLERFEDTSERNSVAKSATARCDDGLEVVGAGGDITRGRGQVRIQSILPDAAGRSVTVSAAEDQNGTAERWTVRAYAICAEA
jgi:hypothetical protein